MKDWELHLALNDPTDPIHDHIERQLEGAVVWYEHPDFIVKSVFDEVFPPHSLDPEDEPF